MVQSPEEQTAKMVESLPETTGKSMPEWLALTAIRSFRGDIEEAPKKVEEG